MRASPRISAAALAFGALLGGTGCGGSLYSIQANAAAGKLEEARALGAEKKAPYEFHYAQEHLAQAESEAAEGDYSDALAFASTAEDYARRAVELCRETRRRTAP